MIESLTSFGVLVALTIGITEVIKRAFSVETKFVPLGSVAIGLILVAVANFTELAELPILLGLVIGLTASGLFDQKLLFGK